MSERKQQTLSLRGTISSVGFSSGHRFVIGAWSAGPVGPMLDVMWAMPNGTRVLLAESTVAADFITSVYAFDEVRLGDLRADVTRRDLHLRSDAASLELDLRGGRGVTLPLVRPAWVTRWIEGPIARRVMGVQTFGVSPTGVSEWYRATSWRPVRSAVGRFEGEDLGAMAAIEPAVGFGFSEPPRRPSIVSVRPLLRADEGVMVLPDRADVAASGIGVSR